MKAAIRGSRLIIEGALDDATIAALQQFLGDSVVLPDIEPAGAPSIAELRAWVSYNTGVGERTIVSNLRSAAVARARIALAWGARTLLDRTNAQIGLAMGDRSHSTIRHAHARATALIASDPAFRSLTERMAAHFADRLQETDRG